MKDVDVRIRSLLAYAIRQLMDGQDVLKAQVQMDEVAQDLAQALLALSVACLALEGRADPLGDGIAAIRRIVDAYSKPPPGLVKGGGFIALLRGAFDDVKRDVAAAVARQQGVN